MADVKFYFQYWNKFFVAHNGAYGDAWKHKLVFRGQIQDNFFYAGRNISKLQYGTSERGEKTNYWITSWIKFSQGFATKV